MPTGFRTRNIGRQLGDKIGETVKVELDEEVSGWRDYLRIRVKLDLGKALTRVVYISVGKDRKREVFSVKYEKLPKFCAVCGLLGHVDTECGNGVHDRKAFQYGDWLIASSEKKGKVKGSMPSGSTHTKGSFSREPDNHLFPGASSEHENGGNSQRGLANDDNFLKDDARSPLENYGSDQQKSDEVGARKRLALDVDGEQDGNKFAMAIVPSIGKTKGLYNSGKTIGGPLLGDPNNNELEDRNLKGRRSKRLRKEDGEIDVHGIEMRSAGSLEEHRRGQ